MLDSLPLGGQKLDQLSRVRLSFWLAGWRPCGRAGGASGIFDGYVPLLASYCPVGSSPGQSCRPVRDGATVLSPRLERSSAAGHWVPMVTHVTNRVTAATFKATARRPGSLPRWQRPGSRTVRDMPRFVIDVMLKPEIHDPQGEAIASACRRLGFGQVAGVRQGKRFEIELTEPVEQERMAELAAELLANPVIEVFSVHPA